MAFFKDNVIAPRDSAIPPRPVPVREPEQVAAVNPPADTGRRTTERAESRAEPRADAKESFIAADLTVDGKIEGVGNVRIAGRFKGDVQVQGKLTIDTGAHLTGLVKARQVIVGGELHGNIDGAQRVELLDTGVLVGDVKAGSLTVAAGSRMRGKVEFGWDEKGAPGLDIPRSNGPAA
jgi:cytoskeletal protein CcmA (bactofilin family)